MKKILIKSLLACILFLQNLNGQSQDSAAVCFPKHQWGVQFDGMGSSYASATYMGSSNTSTSYMEGITFRTGRHKFQLSAMFLSEHNHNRFVLTGPYFNYKFFAFKPRKFFNAYFNFTANFSHYEQAWNVSKMGLDTSGMLAALSGVRARTSNMFTSMLGSGFEFTLYKKLYLDLALAFGVRYLSVKEIEIYFEENGRTYDSSVADWRFSSQLRVGLGYKF